MNLICKNQEVKIAGYENINIMPDCSSQDRCVFFVSYTGDIIVICISWSIHKFKWQLYQKCFQCIFLCRKLFLHDRS